MSSTRLAEMMSDRGFRWSLTAVSKTEAGYGRVVTAAELVSLADIFGVSLDELAGRTAQGGLNMAVDRLVTARFQAGLQLRGMQSRLMETVAAVSLADTEKTFAELVSDANDAIGAMQAAGEALTQVGLRNTDEIRKAQRALLDGWKMEGESNA